GRAPRGVGIPEGEVARRRRHEVPDHGGEGGLGEGLGRAEIVGAVHGIAVALSPPHVTLNAPSDGSRDSLKNSERRERKWREISANIPRIPWVRDQLHWPIEPGRQRCLPSTHSAPLKSALRRSAPVRSAPVKSASRSVARKKCARRRSA